MNVLVLGSGGREHALAWKIGQSPNLDKLYAMPGNPGTAQIGQNIAGSPNDFNRIKEVVVEHSIDMVVVGPEEPLVKGLADCFQQDPALKDILFIGPTSRGAALEGSKQFAKEFMLKHSIPTADFRSFTSDSIAEADAFLESLSAPYVLKADGLAAGKGVLICQSLDQAKQELRSMLGGKFGSAGNTVVIEQFLSGIEVSMFILTDGTDYLLLPEAKDYKRIGDGDKGPNTGGMGAVSPVPFVDSEFCAKVRSRIIEPTLAGLRADGIPYKGFIFFGLMNCAGNPYVIEYNVRMGDPETEAVLTRIQSDLLGHLVACAKGKLREERLEITQSMALTVVCVSAGYPESYSKGKVISGSDLLYSNTSSAPVKVFHSGTSASNGKTLLTAGGRVLAITANNHTLCNDMAEAIDVCRQQAYAQIENISYEGKTYRKDIGLDLTKLSEV